MPVPMRSIEPGSGIAGTPMGAVVTESAFRIEPKSAFGLRLRRGIGGGEQRTEKAHQERLREIERTVAGRSWQAPGA